MADVTSRSCLYGRRNLNRKKLRIFNDLNLIMVNLKTESKMYIFQRKEVLLIEGNSSKFNTNLT